MPELIAVQRGTENPSPDRPLYFGYHTPGPYADEARAWEVSVKALGLQYRLIEIPDRGSWLRNVQAKADVCAEMLASFDSYRLVYCDVDAVVVGQPVLFATLTCDLAAHWFERRYLCSGTLYFRANERTRNLARRWQQLTDEFPDTLPSGLASWDQRLLAMAVSELRRRGELYVSELPPDLCWIPELTQREYPDAQPIILHTRGSLRHCPDHP